MYNRVGLLFCIENILNVQCACTAAECHPITLPQLILHVYCCWVSSHHLTSADPARVLLLSVIPLPGLSWSCTCIATEWHPITWSQLILHVYCCWVSSHYLVSADPARVLLLSSILLLGLSWSCTCTAAECHPVTQVLMECQSRHGFYFLGKKCQPNLTSTRNIEQVWIISFRFGVLYYV